MCALHVSKTQLGRLRVSGSETCFRTLLLLAILTFHTADAYSVSLETQLLHANMSSHIFALTLINPPTPTPFSQTELPGKDSQRSHRTQPCRRRARCLGRRRSPQRVWHRLCTRRQIMDQSIMRGGFRRRRSEQWSRAWRSLLSSYHYQWGHNLDHTGSNHRHQ
jgi:hypothetical protein